MSQPLTEADVRTIVREEIAAAATKYAAAVAREEVDHATIERKRRMKEAAWSA